ncbi:hypothetical protein DFH07DRAFT_938274 [Mycena maculata]|uniref:Uncharacterized protein n=1 Tax=Mycena maculata TaxID=230809 RepID=A0AAD7JTC0_9AGAR|nr:hypothetical protein DFH07DRAFT_938274 [Mycena maculata]
MPRISHARFTAGIVLHIFFFKMVPNPLPVAFQQHPVMVQLKRLVIYTRAQTSGFFPQDTLQNLLAFDRELPVPTTGEDLKFLLQSLKMTEITSDDPSLTFQQHLVQAWPDIHLNILRIMVSFRADDKQASADITKTSWCLTKLPSKAAEMHSLDETNGFRKILHAQILSETHDQKAVIYVSLPQGETTMPVFYNFGVKEKFDCESEGPIVDKDFGRWYSDRRARRNSAVIDDPFAIQFVARTSQHAYAQVNLLTCTSQFVGNDLGTFSQSQGISRFSRAPALIFAMFTRYPGDL